MPPKAEVSGADRAAIANPSRRRPSPARGVD